MIEDALRQVLGKKLRSIVGTFHVNRGKVSSAPISVWLGFDDVRRYRFGGASDGWHLVMDEVEPKEVDMQDAGAIRVCDMGRDSPFSKMLDQRVVRVWLMSSSEPRDIVGVRFDLDTATLRILNWGDEMYVAEDLPIEAGPGEIAESPIE